MKVSAILFSLVAGLAMTEAAPCSGLVNGAVDTAVSALKGAFALGGAPANLNSAIDAGVAAFKGELGCDA